ncbi:hypothetical protein G7Y79_00001g001610 [Physcia stellaris]|nr:hypothetical protein G7Y79_00001g001610 [Physcia stellaris]
MAPPSTQMSSDCFPVSTIEDSYPSSEPSLPAVTMDQREERKNVLIIGGAIAGTVFALQLLAHPTLRAKYRPIIFDSAPTLPGLESFKDTLGSETSGQSGAAVALTRQAMYPLRQLNLGPELENICQNTEQLSLFRQPFWGPQDGSQKGVGIVNASADPDIGVMGGMWAIERGPLQALLIQKFLERGGEIHINKRLNKIIEHDYTATPASSPSAGPIEAVFEDKTTYNGTLLIGADGAWSTVRKHLFTTIHPRSGKPTVDPGWKPNFQNLQIIHGISHAPTTDTSAAIYSYGLRGAGCATWTLRGPSGNTGPSTNPPRLLPLRNARVYSGGYSTASTQAIAERYKHVWHPSAGTFGALFSHSEKFIRVGLWQGLFTRVSNVRWAAAETLPRECGKDRGGTGRGNVVLVGDAGRVLMPTAGQGAAFAIEDATVLADCVLNYPPSSAGAVVDFGDALKEYTRRRLPRYRRIEAIATFAARMSVGGSGDGGYGKLGEEGPEGKGKGKRKGWWWEDWTSDRWLVGERFEVREEGGRVMRSQR